MALEIVAFIAIICDIYGALGTRDPGQWVPFARQGDGRMVTLVETI